MTFNEIVTEVKDYLKAKEAAGNKNHFVAEVKITDGDGGVFYIEFDNEKINVEPKSYPKKNVRFITDSDTFKKIVDGALDPQKAFTDGRLKLEKGVFDVPKALQFGKIYAMVKDKV